jgi:hypothetical protein
VNRWHLTVAFAGMLATQTGKSVTPTKGPTTGTGQKFTDLLPYAVVYAISGNTPPGAMDGTFPITNVVYQVTSVGQNESQCEGLAALVRAAVFDPSIPLTSAALTADGVTVLLRSPNAGPTPPQESPDGVVSVAERFTLPVSGA